jgi:hypothetical protein
MATTTCGWCKTFSHLDQVHSPAVLHELGKSALVTCAFKCAQCGRISIAWVNEDSPYLSMSGQDATELLASRNDDLQWLPRAGTAKDYTDVPAHIAAAASECHECLSIGAYRAAVMLSRSVVEATAKAKGINEHNLVAKIDELAAQQLIRPIVQEVAHEIRHLGNDMAHGDFVDPVTREEAEETVGLMGEVLQEVFQAPAAIDRRRRARLAKQAAKLTAPSNP